MLQREMDILNRLEGLDEAAMEMVRERLNQLTKPPGSLGRLEDLAIRWTGISRLFPPREVKASFLLMAGDHGVVAEGVAPYPQEVTPQMVRNILQGGAAINAMSEAVGAEVCCVDVGVAADLTELPFLRQRKVRWGTANLAQESAMQREEALAALQIGVEEVGRLVEQGFDVIALGEMGIGNTTPSSCLLAALSDAPLDEVVGRGTGLDASGVERKKEVVARALQRCNSASVGREDLLGLMAQIGGLEIAALAGACLGGGVYRVPIIIDGFIVTTAALWAQMFCPRVADFLFVSHCSAEQGHARALQELGQKPYYDLEMRLGEGTGAALMVPLFRAAGCVFHGMATFAEAGVSSKKGDG